MNHDFKSFTWAKGFLAFSQRLFNVELLQCTSIKFRNVSYLENGFETWALNSNLKIRLNV